MPDMTYVELFAGAGGLSLGLERAGWTCLAHAEIEPHARAVLRKHWPDTPLEGDVSTLDGTKYRGVTLLTGGSPCQDLSIAGKRAGMVEGSGTRSSLYFEQVRIWQESEAPYFLWENVCGALSSNNGRDFAAVLSALVGAAIPVPSDGWESAGVAAGPTGVAAWRVLDAQFFGVPQRRRRVFVLGTRTGGVDPAEVLFENESLCGDSAPSREAGEGVAADTGAGVALSLDAECNPGVERIGALNTGSASGGGRPTVVLPRAPDAGTSVAGGDGAIAFEPRYYTRDNKTAGAPSPLVSLTASLAKAGDAVPHVIADAGTGAAGGGAFAVNISNGVASVDPVMGTLGSRSGGQEVGNQTRGVVMAVPTYDARGKPGDGEVVNADAGTGAAGGCWPIDTRNATRTTDKSEQNRQGVGIGEDGDPSPSLTGMFVPAVVNADAGTGAAGGVRVAHAIQNPGLEKAQNGLGIAGPNAPMYTLEGTGHGVVTYDARGNGDGEVVNTLAGDHQNRVTDYTAIVMRQREGKPGGGKGPLLSAERERTLGTTNDQVVFPTLSMGAHTAAPGSNGQDAEGVHLAMLSAGVGRPRRLMPVECERLMGWGDGHTAFGVDEKGREYALADTPRYKLCGNGVASPVAQWIGWRLALALGRQETAS